jgi:Ca2+:H+ antiporter
MSAHTKSTTTRSAGRLPLSREWFLVVSISTVGIFFLFGPFLEASLSTAIGLLLVFAWLFSVILGSALSVVRHAEQLAERLGEPLGTLILTLSVTAIEVMSISAVMVHGENNPTLVRDTLFSVIMIVLNGMVGASILIGAWRHREQHYNLQGANSYLSVIIPLAVLSLIMPDFTESTSGPTLSYAQEVFLSMMALGLYVAFLAMQTGRHRGYFTLEDLPRRTQSDTEGNSTSVLHHGLLLISYMLPVIFLTNQFAHPVDYLLETLRLPQALGGVIIGTLVATPEAVGAVRSALANQLQRSVNIFLGSVLSTIGLTIPIMVFVAHFTGRPFYLGLQNSSFVMLLLTLFLSAVTFASGRTNVLQGAVHLFLFVAYILLIFQS